MLLPDTPLADAAVLAERIRHSIATLSFQTPGGVVIRGITVSIGAAPMAASMTGIDDLLRNGDTAMYGAKNNGRNRIEVFHEN